MRNGLFVQEIMFCEWKLEAISQNWNSKQKEMKSDPKKAVKSDLEVTLKKWSLFYLDAKYQLNLFARIVFLNSPIEPTPPHCNLQYHKQERNVLFFFPILLNILVKALEFGD